MEENDRRLLDDLAALVSAAQDLPGVDPDAHKEPALAALALGGAVLGREMALGVSSEVQAEPPRGLNALRLARHLLELEHELHYAHADPEHRLVQFQRREASTKTWMPRYVKAFKAARVDEDTKDHLAAMAEEGERLDREAKARAEAGEDVPANDWGTVPNRKTLAKALGRTNEYRAHYEPASWLSHPSIGALENILDVDEIGVLHDRSSTLAASLPGMALSLARMTYARVLRRAFEILGHSDRLEMVTEFMEARGIGETGLVESEPPEQASAS